jgi:hypothetical protein
MLGRANNNLDYKQTTKKKRSTSNIKALLPDKQNGARGT